jgi:hypothetical protein
MSTAVASHDSNATENMDVVNTQDENQHLIQFLSSQVTKLEEENKKLNYEISKYDSQIKQLERVIQQQNLQIKSFEDQQAERLRRKAEKAKRQKEEEERERKIRERLRPFVLQSKVSSFPSFSSLAGQEIFLGDLVEVQTNPETKNFKICFYVVNHTARFESVNMSFETLRNLKSKLPGSTDSLNRLLPLFRSSHCDYCHDSRKLIHCTRCSKDVKHRSTFTFLVHYIDYCAL